MNSAIGLVKLEQARQTIMTMGKYSALDDDFNPIVYEGVAPCLITHCRISNNQDRIIVEACLNNAPTWEQIKTKLSNKLGCTEEQIETHTLDWHISTGADWNEMRESTITYLKNNKSEFKIEEV